VRVVRNVYIYQAVVAENKDLAVNSTRIKHTKGGQGLKEEGSQECHAL